MVRINGAMKPLNLDVLKQSDMEKMLPEVMDEDQLKIFKEKKRLIFLLNLRKGRLGLTFSTK